MGSGCGSVGRAVASDTRDPSFESSHSETFIEQLFAVNCVEKTKIKKKRPEMVHLKKKTLFLTTLVESSQENDFSLAAYLAKSFGFQNE